MYRLCLIIALLLSPFLNGNAEPISQAEIKEFYQIDNQAYAKVKDNALVAAMGLTAPVNVKDSYNWGLKLVQKHPSIMLNEFKSIPDKLVLTTSGKGDGMSCWLGRKSGQNGKKEGDKPCFSKEEIEKFIVENKLFLERFRQLTQMPHFIELPPFTFWAAQELIGGEKLYMADLIVSAEQNRETSLQAWIENMKSVRSWNTDQGSLVMRSIALVTYGLVVHQLPAILGNDNALAAKYKQELGSVLAPLPVKDMNISLVMKTDFQFAKGIYESLGDNTMLRLYGLDSDFAALAQVPAFDFQQENKKFTAKYNALPDVSVITGIKLYLRIHHLTFIPLNQHDRDSYGDMLVKGIVPASSMINTMNIVDTNTRMYNIYAQIRGQNVARNKIGEFIKNAPPEMQDPFSGKSFDYDAKTNTIFSQCKIQEPSYWACSLNLD